MTANTCETEAIVLNTKDFGESDRLISFYTESAGKLRGIAKGARRSRKRFSNTFELCNLVELGYRQKKAYTWIEACKLVEPHLSLRTEIERWGYAALLSEIVLEMTPEGEAQPELFSLLKAALAQLTEDKDPINVVLLFLVRFLDIMGYLPALDRCGVCRKPIEEATTWWWHTERGSLTCREHRPGNAYLMLKLDLGTLVLMRQCRQLPLGRIWRLRILQEKKVPILYGLLDWVRNHIGKDLKSLKLLQQVQAM
ncbi:MAG: DNA repair protein RecO [Acidobacteriota bacterium]